MWPRASALRLTTGLRVSLVPPPRGAQYGADLDARTAKDWTPLSYARAKGKYGVTHEKGIYPEDVLKVRRSAYGLPQQGCAQPC